MTSEPLRLSEHLGELRHRLKIAFISYAIMFAIFLLAPANPTHFITFTGTYVPFVALFLARVKLDLLPAGWSLISSNLNEPLEVYFEASVVLAAIFNSPIFAYETIMFVTPGLTEREKKLVYPFVFASTTLFIVGVLFGYFLLAKFLFIALSPFFEAAQATPLIDVSNFYFIVFLVVAMSGFAFTIPVYVFMLIRLRVINPASFRKNRVIIWVIVYIATAIITPDGGPLLDVALFVPIIVLLELAVFLGARSIRNQPPPAQPPAPDTCAYCGAKLGGATFCPNCGRSAA